jgi:hypothetical protein
MVKRLVILAAVVAGVACAFWNLLAAEYFGRIDPVAWERGHPPPPPPPAEPGPWRAEVVATRRVVPSEGLPPGVSVLRANNNLDVVRHVDGRVYLAWRTAPSHFAGSRTVVNVVSSIDEEHWRFEARLAPGFDLREPRLLSQGDRLMLYVSRFGTNPFAFQPQGMAVTQRRPDGSWSALEPVGPPGFIAWRTRVVDGRSLMIGYSGGGGLYSFHGATLGVELLTSSDGRRWSSAFGLDPVVLTGGGSETDFVFDAQQDLYAVSRNEAGDSGGFGSKLCHASWNASWQSPGAWQCRADAKKYDSPLLFAHHDQIYVVGRRNVTASGDYDIAGGPRLWRAIRNALAYITTAKRCSLWRFDREENRLAFVLDLPSRGDTCFASALPGPSADEVVLYDYSSDIAGPDLPWAAGQRRATFIYRHVLRFTHPGGREAHQPAPLPHETAAR